MCFSRRRDKSLCNLFRTPQAFRGRNLPFPQGRVENTCKTCNPCFEGPFPTAAGNGRKASFQSESDGELLFPPGSQASCSQRLWGLASRLVNILLMLKRLSQTGLHSISSLKEKSKPLLKTYTKRPMLASQRSQTNAHPETMGAVAFLRQSLIRMQSIFGCHAIL